MKIYFAGSIRAGRQDVELYRELIACIGRYGAVLTEHVGDDDLESVGEKMMSDAEIHDRDMDWLAGSDAVVAEVTTPSLGVGYEIASAIALAKPILCLYRPQQGRTLSAMIAGSPAVTIVQYRHLEEAANAIERFLRGHDSK